MGKYITMNAAAMISKMFAKIPPAFRLHKTQKGESPHIENSPLLSQLPKVPFMALGGINDPGSIKCPRRHSSHHRFNSRTPDLSIAGRHPCFLPAADAHYPS
ncbi:MAG: hypothetical protein M0Z70_13150 [Nitrospiraceae bacterium]|nr:hypothetical protein [Nitrospiraceae bacterium]